MATKQFITGVDVSVTSSFADGGKRGQLIRSATDPVIFKGFNAGTTALLPGQAVTIDTTNTSPRMAFVKPGTSDTAVVGVVILDTNQEPEVLTTQNIEIPVNGSVTVMAGFGALYVPVVNTVKPGYVLAANRTRTGDNIEAFILGTDPSNSDVLPLYGLLALSEGSGTDANPVIVRAQFAQCSAVLPW